jgi:acetyltransferase-like isoleucine patch superfamily enzyme
MLTKIITKIFLLIGRITGPVVIPGFRSADGLWRPRTRYSSSTYFQGKDKIVMGDLVYIAPFCFVDGSNGLEIGEGAQVCSWVSLLTHSSHISIRLYGKEYAGSEMKGYLKGSLFIGAYTFIGPHSTLMPNTSIGKGSIVAAYSYVEGEFPEFSILGGNPARVIGDTRKLDQPFLDNHPELRPLYEQWAGNQKGFHLSND